MTLVKNETKIERLYMIDIVERSKKEIEVIMHFVNKRYDPMLSPEIKRYRMNLDEHTQEFLLLFESEVELKSQFYSMVNAQFGRNN